MVEENKLKKLTVMQEKFCQEYVKLSSPSKAYRASYNAENMKPATIGTKSNHLINQYNISARILELRTGIENRNKITIDELVVDLANMVRFDPGDMYDDNGALLPIKQMPKNVRQMILSLDSIELYQGTGKRRIQVGEVKKVRLMPKLEAIEKLMKYFGAYEKDNNQKTPVQQVTIFQIPDNDRQ